MSTSQRSSRFVAVRFIIGVAICGLFFTLVFSKTRAAEFSFIEMAGHFMGLHDDESTGQKAAGPNTDDAVAIFNGPIVFQRGFLASFDFPFFRGGKLYKIDPSSGSETLFGDGSQPNYSVDGSKIVFTLNSQIARTPASTYTPTGLTILGGGSAITGFYPKWSPDALSIAYNTSNAATNGTLYYHIKILGGSCSACDIGPEMNRGVAISNLYPGWSPAIVPVNGSRAATIAYVQTPATRTDILNGNYSGDIVSEAITIAADGTVTDGAITNLTNSAAQYGFPAYSHDGTKIAFVKFNADGSSSLFVMNSNGSNKVAIVNYPSGNSLSHHPNWSPDDSKLAFSDSNQIFQISPIAGQQPAAVTTLASSDTDLFPSWAPGTGNPTPTPTPTPTPSQLSATLNFEGRLRDRVGKSDAGIFPDGESDGTFSLTLPPAAFAKSFQSIVIAGPNANVWDTIPQTTNIKWVVGVADALDRPLLNQADGSINAPVGSPGTFKLFVPDSNPTSFLLGKTFTVTVNFSDGSIATASTTIGKTQADLEIRFNPLNPPPSSIHLGQTGSYSILVNNNGPEIAHGVTVTGIIPVNASLAPGTSSFCTSVVGIAFNCSLGDLDPSSTPHATSGTGVFIFNIVLRSTFSGPLTLTANVSLDDARSIDNVSTNNSATTTTAVIVDAQLTGLEVTQAVQNLKNDTPLVAGRRTFVRAYVKNLSSIPVPATATLTAKDLATNTVLGTVKNSNSNSGGRIRVLPNPLRSELDDSFYFEIPNGVFQGQPDWTKAGNIQFTFSGNEFPFTCNEPDGTPDCKVTVAFQNRRGFSMRLFFTSGKDPAGNIKFPSFPDVLQSLSEITSQFPVKGFGGDGIVITPDIWPIDQAYCTIAGQAKIRDDLVAKRAADCATGPCEDIYFALVPESVASGICGLNFQASGKAAISYGDPTKPTYPSYPSIGIKTDNSGNAYMAISELFNSRAHELGHNFGFPHTCYTLADGTVTGGGGCLPVMSGDGSVTVTDGTISLKKVDTDPDTYFGFDVNRPTLQGVFGTLPCTPVAPKCGNGYLGHSRVYGPYSPDMMSYGPAAWISAYSYKRIFDSLAPLSGRSEPDDADRVRISLVNGKAFQINGSITTATGAGQIGSVSTIDVNGTLTLPLTGDWAISIRDAQSLVLASYGIQFQSDVDGGPTSGFSLTAPWNAAARSIVLLHNGQIVATRQASTNPPIVTVTFPNGGETLSGQTATFAWTASDPDGGPLTYGVDYSTDNGATWKALAINWTSTTYPVDLDGLRASNQALIRVTASDGFNTAQDSSNAFFTVPQHSPVASISAPENNHLYVGDQTISLAGIALDTEDGILGAPRLSWGSNLNGPLGTGTSLAINAMTLAEGTHTITVTATDSTARAGTASITIQVFRIRPVFPAGLSVGPTGLALSASSGTVLSVSQTLAIRNSGDGDLTWSAAADQPWIRLDSTGGLAPSNLSVTADPTGLSIGAHTGNVTLTSAGASGSPQTVQVVFTINAAPPVTVDGKVVTPDGRGLRNATVSITDAQGIVQTATTSSFGFFSFGNINSGQTYTLRVSSRLYRFAARSVQVNDNLTLPDFVGLE